MEHVWFCLHHLDPSTSQNTEGLSSTCLRKPEEEKQSTVISIKHMIEIMLFLLSAMARGGGNVVDCIKLNDRNKLKWTSEKFLALLFFQMYSCHYNTSFRDSMSKWQKIEIGWNEEFQWQAHRHMFGKEHCIKFVNCLLQFIYLLFLGSFTFHHTSYEYVNVWYLVT